MWVEDIKQIGEDLKAMDEGLVSFGSDQKPTKKINKAIGIVLDSFGEFGESHIIDQNVFEKDL